jgi:HTH-type transcriptional regulator/antitoxin HigA
MLNNYLYANTPRPVLVLSYKHKKLLQHPNLLQNYTFFLNINYLMGAAFFNCGKQEKTLMRIEELLSIVDNDTPTTDKNFIELDLLSDLVADYEAIHFPVNVPTLPEVIKLSMQEHRLTQKEISNLLGISTSRVSEYLSGKCEPTLRVARLMHKKLNIDANMILA